ncbi:hypothetical protein BH23GEM9_BH23GEM9_20450 [soil metagenome]
MKQRNLFGIVSCLNPLRGVRAAWGAGALLSVLGAHAPVLAQTMPGTTVVNTATGRYQDVTGSAGSAQANATFVVGEPAQADARMRVTKQVDRAHAQTDDVLTWTVHWAVTSGRVPAPLTITDSIPAGVQYEAGSLRLNGQALTDAADDDAGTVSGGVVRFRFMPYAGDSGTVTFRARVANGVKAGDTLRNVAHAAWSGGIAPVSSAPTLTAIVEPALRLTKDVVGESTVSADDIVLYRIVAHNGDAHAVLRDLLVRDSLPDGLELVAATPALVNGTWHVATLAARDSMVFLVQTRVRLAAPDGPLLNRVSANMANASATAEASALIRVQRAQSANLRVELAAVVLEAAPGENALFVASVDNTGAAGLADVLVEVVLPAGTRFVPGSVTGAELVSAAGGVLVVRIPVTLHAGARASFSYAVAIVAPQADLLTSSATASAQAGAVLSNESVATLRLHRNRAVETRTVVGRVWADANNNGRQDPGEPGIAGIDVWTNDGAVARTDAQGRFSFVNLRAGTHHIRVDPATMPTVYAVPAGDGMTSVRVTGWNTPQALLPLRPLTDQERGASGAQPSPKPHAVSDTVRIAPARTEAERAAERQSALVSGPGVRIVQPIDGAVVASNRVLLAIQAEPDVPVTLFRGDSVLVETRLRRDGTQEFISMPLRAGLNVLRVRVVDGWGQQRWDSVHVHVSGRVASIAAPASRIRLPADGRSTYALRFRILDDSGVPVVSQPHMTVAGENITITTPDSYRASAGTQVQADEAGWAVVEFRSGMQVGSGSLRLSAGAVVSVVAVELVAPVLPFMVTGAGEVGIGAAPDAYAAITARGRVADNTSLTVSLDTRHLDDGGDVFGRAVDPFAEGHYPILGDASERRHASAARGRLAARLERGLDYVAAGDIQTTLGTGQGALSRYSRSVTGASARVATGPLVWTGFGALGAQSLRQVQLRGEGTSGPFIVAQSIVPGTEQVHVEVRERDNAQHILTRRRLTPFMDYQIDYRSGTILLKQALPSADAVGNHVFLVVTAEAHTGDERSAVWGGRVDADVSRAAGATEGGVVVGGSIVHDAQGLTDFDLITADVTLAPASGMQLRAEIARAVAGDSAGFAGGVAGRAALLGGRLALDGRWTRTGEEFRNPSNVGVIGGSEDIAASAALRLGGSELRLEHSQQEFTGIGIDRRRTALALRQSLLANTQVEGRVTNDDIAGAGGARGGGGEVRLTWTPLTRLRMWGEGRAHLWGGAADARAGDHIGGGVAWQLLEQHALEARHLQVTTPAGDGYSVTDIGLRSTLAGGTQAWGSYQLVGGLDGASNAALVGLNQRLSLGEAWRVSTLFERRAGLERAPAADPVRGLPFLQQESDYWSGSLGVEYLPQDEPWRLSAKTERRQGDLERHTLATVAGDVSFSASLALLGRQEFLRRSGGPLAENGTARLQRSASIFGLAWRPAARDDINALLEFRWRIDENPQGAGVFSAARSDERMIGAAEVIWSPLERIDLGARFALRHAQTTIALSDLPAAELRSDASFYGARAEIGMTRWLGLRTEARLLDEKRAGDRAWDVAPALVLRAVEGIEIAGGHRWGHLRDIDFAVNGGEGFFLTLTARLTERTLPTAAGFWRSRMGVQR